ncbi:hypothetical protein [Algoriphagus litoralis]|uniref:hypothetical protein n=1 Tax=Algoriphagus litoralis TaxID=2202829 RepID=UPI000DB9FE15|nr:hypothetical protein [Algoriphagus litoralis]
MKKYILAFGIGALLLGSACDPIIQEALTPESAEAELLAENDSNGENLRKSKGKVETQWKVEEATKAHRLMEITYQMLPSYLPLDKVNRTFESSRSADQFVAEMINESLKIFDSNIERNGRFLSPLARRNHQAMRGDEHEIEYDLVAAKFRDDDDALASMAGYLKIGDIKGESTDNKSAYHLLKYIGKNGPGNAMGGCPDRNNPACDSIPPIQAPQLEEMVEFLPVLKRAEGKSVPTAAALNDLKWGTDLDPVAIALILPAVQKIADNPAPTQSNGDHKDWIIIESMARRYGVNLGDSRGTFLAFGAGGSIFGLINEKYDASGDLDWAAIQLNRRKFEFEMWLFWSKWAASKSSGTAPGR